MSSSKGPNKKTRKFIKRLSPWIKKVQSFRLFDIRSNAKYNIRQILELPISAALHNSSIENEGLFKDRISADDFYHHANNKLKEAKIAKMLRRYVAEVLRLLKNYFCRTSFEIAIDKTDDPYWGKKENHYVTGGKREHSTNYAFRYLTAAIAVQRFEFVLYARPLTKADDNDALLVEECIIAIKRLGVTISRVLLDREFYNSMIILFCNVADIEYIIPMKKDSRFERLLSELKKEGKKLPRIIENYEINKQLTNLIIYEDKNSKGETEIFGFITNIDADKIAKDVYAIADFYRRRWAIENANKFQDKFNISTNSTNGVVRFFFFVLTALLHNFWVLLALIAKRFNLMEISIRVFKNIFRKIFCFDTLHSYKHPQRELWMKVLVG